MKVIHLISGGDSGGAKTHVFSLLQGLSHHIKADMVCFTEGPFAQQARALGIPTAVLPGRNIFSVLHQLRQLVREGDYDLIHCHGSRGNLMGALLHLTTGLPVVTTVHSDPELDYMGRFFGRLVFGSLNAWALRRIPYHIGVSDAMADLLIDRGIAGRGIYAIYNGIEFTPVPPAGDRLAYLRGLGAEVDEDSVVVGIAARLNPVKDMSTLIRGYAAAYAQCPRLRLVIAGDGEELDKLKALARKLGVERQVTFAGWINGMDAFYSAIDINALTSLSETFPYALTEGSRYKLATVASAVGGIPNLIDSGVNGYLFPAGDWEALGHCLAELGSNDPLRMAFGQRLYDKASVKFSLERTIETQLEIYEKVLRREGCSRAHRDGAVVCGAYGRGNAGDEAIMRAIVAELRSIDPALPICIMTRRPKLARRECRTEAVYTFNWLRYRRAMATAKLYVNGGGSLIQDISSRRSLWFYLSTLATAKRQGCKVMMYGCGIGPVNFPSDRTHAAKIIDRSVDVITLRDENSARELESMGVTRPRVILAADPTVTLPPADPELARKLLRDAGLKPEAGQRYVGVSMRPWHGFEAKASLIAEALDGLYADHGLIPVFIPIEARLDVGAASQVAACLRHAPYAILSESRQGEQVSALFAQMDMVLSMRLHALIFSAVHGVPLVGIVYDPKVSAFLDSVGQDLYAPLAKLTTESLRAQLEQAAARRDQRPLLEQKARSLLELEKNNLSAARGLLKG